MAPRSTLAGLSGKRVAAVCLGIAVAASAAFLIDLDSQLTFTADDWMLLVKRNEWSVNYFLHPFHGSIVLGPGIVYKLLLATFGMGSSLPYYVVAIAAFLTSAVLLYVYLCRRVGDWLALFGAILILFLGAAFEDLLFAFQMGYFCAVAAGLGALVALDREDALGDRLACALLVVSLAFSTVGIPFAVAALADLAFGRSPRKPRAYVSILPIALFGLWWIGWGHTAEQYLSIDNLIATPKYVFDASAAGVTSLLGLATGDGSEPSQPHLIWGKLGVAIGLVLLGFRMYRDGGVTRGMAVALAVGLTFWVLAGLNHNEGRAPTSSRYQFPSAVFLLLIAGEILRGWRVPRLAIACLAVVTGLAVAGGVSLIQREQEERWVPSSNFLRSSLAAVEVAGESADPDSRVYFPPDIRAPVKDYLSVVNQHGSPAFTEAELVGRSSTERAVADPAGAVALGLALTPRDPAARTLGCQTLQASETGETGTTLLHGGFSFANLGGSDVEVQLSRFADGISVDMGPLAAGGETQLTIPVDESSRAWTLWLTGEGPVRLCTLQAA